MVETECKPAKPLQRRCQKIRGNELFEAEPAETAVRVFVDVVSSTLSGLYVLPDQIPESLPVVVSGNKPIRAEDPVPVVDDVPEPLVILVREYEARVQITDIFHEFLTHEHIRGHWGLESVPAVAFLSQHIILFHARSLAAQLVAVGVLSPETRAHALHRTGNAIPTFVDQGYSRRNPILWKHHVAVGQGNDVTGRMF